MDKILFMINNREIIKLSELNCLFFQKLAKVEN